MFDFVHEWVKSEFPLKFTISLLGDSPDKDYYLRAGHDINFLAETGILSIFTGETCSRPIPASTAIADFFGGSLISAFGIMMALYEREKTGLGKVRLSSIVFCLKCGSFFR